MKPRVRDAETPPPELPRTTLSVTESPPKLATPMPTPELPLIVLPVTRKPRELEMPLPELPVIKQSVTKPTPEMPRTRYCR